MNETDLLYKESLSSIFSEICGGNLRKAEYLIGRALSKHPDDAELLAKLIVVQKNSKNYKGAMQSLLTFIKELHGASNIYNEFSGYYADLLKLLAQNKKISQNTQFSKHSQEIIDYYFSMPFSDIPSDIFEPLLYIMHYPIYYYPYEDMHADTLGKEILIKAEGDNLSSVIYNLKRLVYDSDSVSKITESHRFLLMEQHEDSPHRYLTESFNAAEGDVVLDIGAAEANFSLDVIEKCGKVIVVESNANWNRAINLTLSPWKEKVTIVNKLISDNCKGNHITIDELVGDCKVDLIKLDVEGFEMKALRGAMNLLKRNEPLKLAVCTYHKQNDAEEIMAFLHEFGLHTEFSNGYMLYNFYDKAEPPYFRRGLIRAWRH